MRFQDEQRPRRMSPRLFLAVGVVNLLIALGSSHGDAGFYFMLGLFSSVYAAVLFFQQRKATAAEKE